MPRAFTANETAAIRARLMTAAAESFARSGIRRTTVDELARSAGISKGAFYGFFDSKESLFLALIGEYELQAHAEIEAAIRTDPRHGLEALIATALHAASRNPLLPVAMSEEGLRVIRSRSPQEQDAFVQRDVRLVERVLDLLRQAGVELQAPATVLVALLRSLVFVGWHRRDIGETLVDELAQWLTPALRAALLPTSAGAER